jgi:hypothetical protein
MGVALLRPAYKQRLADRISAEKPHMSAPDFYFAVNATARHIHDVYGMDTLVDYWRSLGLEYYAERVATWKAGDPSTIAEDWRRYFLAEPGAEVEVMANSTSATLAVRVCPAIKHLRESGRDIVPYYCDHCDHTCSAMAEKAGYVFTRTGGMGSCTQVFVQSAPDADESNEGN